MTLTNTARLVVTGSATGTRHAMTVADRDTTGATVCGSVHTLPGAAALTAPGVELHLAAVTLNDLHLSGVKVCRTCRARVSVAALDA